MIHFLVKREDERAQENLDLKDMVKKLRDTHKQDVRTQASLLKTQSNLMASVDNLTRQVADLTTENKSLQKQVRDLLSQIYACRCRTIRTSRACLSQHTSRCLISYSMITR